ncbi:MAG: GGDEF domain-containing protein, partial [Thermodesulfobacteriota bacterium]
MDSDYLTGIKLSVNKISRARNEVELYNSIAESLIDHFGFNRVTIRKVDWERKNLSLVCNMGFIDEINTFELPLSNRAGVLDEVPATEGAINLYEEDAVLAALRPAPEFSGLNREMSASFHAIFLIKVRGQVVVVVGVDKHTNGEELTSQDKRVLDLFSEIAGGILENVLNKEALIRDELTGLFNRNYFMKRLNEELERAKRYDMPLSCCIFDIDDFKVINDTYGHLFGDHVLREIGRLTKGMVRATDIVARYGGEEFVILFPQTRLDDAVVAAEHIRRTISTLVFLHNEKKVGVTATFGMSSNLPENTKTSSTLLHRADMGLYEGKKQYHKNCIVTYSEYGYKGVNKEESLMRTLENMNDTYDSFPRIESVRLSGIIYKTKFKKSLLTARANRG